MEEVLGASYINIIYTYEENMGRLKLNCVIKKCLICSPLKILETKEDQENIKYYLLALMETIMFLSSILCVISIADGLFLIKVDLRLTYLY